MRLPRSPAIFAAVLLLETAASAQPVSELRAQQAALFTQLEERPTDLEIMFAYALVSMRLQDYEPAIATLERMLIFNPDLPRVRLELGVAYYRLGVYEVARFQFEQALASDPPQEVVERVTPFLEEIASRTARNRVEGFVSVGAVYSTNANLGPTNREILVADLPGGVGTIVDDALPAEDVGLRLAGSLRHTFDLQTPRDDVWISTVGYAGLRYRQEDDGDLDALTVTTGPRLAADDEAFGLKVRPYLIGSVVRSAGDLLYSSGGLGIDLQEAISPQTTVFGFAGSSWRVFDDDEAGNDDFDGLYISLGSGATYRVSENTDVTGAIFAGTDQTVTEETTNYEIGLRASGTRRIGVGELGLPAVFSLPWSATAFAQVSHR
jgi:hypothetical protein